MIGAPTAGRIRPRSMPTPPNGYAAPAFPGYRGAMPSTPRDTDGLGLPARSRTAR